MLRRVAAVPDAGDAADGAGAGAGNLRGGAAALFKVPRLLVGLADWDARRAGLCALIDDDGDGAVKSRLQMRPATTPRPCRPSPPDLAAAGMSVPCGRFYGDVKSGPETTVSGGAHLTAAVLADFPATGSLPATIGCPPAAARYIGSVSATEVEQSEDYTRIIARGPNPKTTHIFGDCILEPCTESYWLVKLSGDEPRRRFCEFCNMKKLDDSDLSFYRGEKVFCSGDCRGQAILTEDEESNTAVSPVSIGSSSSFSEDDVFMAGMAVLT
uniref:FLZ-type domain-containing protein n=1 Tax=Leersia perrieri TaxID=77586 RepID=A0A0D9WDG3_9ORYZ